MQLQFSDIRGRDAGKTGFVLGHGPSLGNHLAALREIHNDKQHFKIISCNNIDKFTDLAFDYWMLAQPANDQSAFCIKNAFNRFNSRPKATLLYTDCLDLTDRNLVKQVLNIDYIGYDQRHFKGKPCTWGKGIGGRHICCQHIIPERLCIQEELQLATKSDSHYSPGDTVGVHMLALAVITGMNPIYITGIDLDYSNGYVTNDFADVKERTKMGMNSINNSPDMVTAILQDFTKIRDMAKNIGVDIYCLDKGLKISEIFPYKPFPGTEVKEEPVQDLIPGGMVIDVVTKPASELIDVITAENLKDIPAGYTGKIKPNDEYTWVNYAPEYAKQLEDIKNNDKQEFFITDTETKHIVSGSDVKAGRLGHFEIVFKNNLHDNWKEIYHHAYRLKPKSVFEVGVGGGYNVKNIQKLLPNAEIFACDISAEQIKKARQFSELSDEQMKNIGLLDFANYFEYHAEKVEFIFSHAVIMHQSTANAVAMLRNMSRISSKYILLIEGIANHDKWYELVKATLPDWDFELTSTYIDYGVLLTRKGTEPGNTEPGNGFDQQRWNAEHLGVSPKPYEDANAEFSGDRGQIITYNFNGQQLTTEEIIKILNERLTSGQFIYSEYAKENPPRPGEPDPEDFIEPFPAAVKDPGGIFESVINAGPKDVTDEDVQEKNEIPLGELQKPDDEPLFIFTEIIGCADVGKMALETFHKYHDHKVHVFTTEADIAAIEGGNERHQNNVFIIVPQQVVDLYKQGHEGTAYIFAEVFSGKYGINNIVHFDSDVYFKRESLSLIKEQFAQGVDIVGSRRCYVNNPAGIPVSPGIPDTVSTYFYGMKQSVIPEGYSFEQLIQMFLGHNIGLDHEVFDFGDCITFHALKKGAKIYFLDSNLVGGQDSNGLKANDHPANLHLDAGSHLVHFGGAGSGCVCYHDPAGKHVDYGKWAVMRYKLFSEVMGGKEVSADAGETKYDGNGRWVGGNYDKHILNLIMTCLSS